MSAEPILQVQRLCKTYATAHGELTVLRNVSFAVPSGSTCAVLGPSGSGKTTLLGLCAGLDRASSGRVRLAGQDLGALSENELSHLRNREIGFVFQDFQLLPTLTALENVMVPLELRGDRTATERGRELLARVGLQDRADHYPVQLSGGEQQRVALARAFCARPSIVFADEPTGNLDDETSGQVQELMFGIHRARGTALVVVTHDQDLAARTQQVIRLRSGSVVPAGPVTA